LRVMPRGRTDFATDLVNGVFFSAERDGKGFLTDLVTNGLSSGVGVCPLAHAGRSVPALRPLMTRQPQAPACM
jgi:hypothetical protein